MFIVSLARKLASDTRRRLKTLKRARNMPVPVGNDAELASTRTHSHSEHGGPHNRVRECTSRPGLRPSRTLGAASTVVHTEKPIPLSTREPASNVCGARPAMTTSLEPLPAWTGSQINSSPAASEQPSPPQRNMLSNPPEIVDSPKPPLLENIPRPLPENATSIRAADNLTVLTGPLECSDSLVNQSLIFPSGLPTMPPGEVKECQCVPVGAAPTGEPKISVHSGRSSPQSGCGRASGSGTTETSTSAQTQSSVDYLCTLSTIAELGRRKRPIHDEAQDSTPTVGQVYDADLRLLRSTVVQLLRAQKGLGCAPTADYLPDVMKVNDITYTHIATGGFGSVYHFLHNGKALAVKIRVRMGPLQDIQDNELMTEALVLKRLKARGLHPNLLQGFQLPNIHDNTDFWLREGVAMMTTDYQLTTLSRIKPIGPDSTNEVKTRLYAAVLGEIASGLNHLHSLDIVHKDLKPDNILISRDGCCLIGDYGACQLERCSRRNPAELITSIGFDAPETMFTQLGGFVQFDERSDFWSLGMTIYALITDCSLFCPKYTELQRNTPHRKITYADLGLDGDDCMCCEMERNGCPAVIRGLVLALCQLEPENRILGSQIVSLTRAIIKDADGVLDRDAPFSHNAILAYSTHAKTNGVYWNSFYGMKWTSDSESTRNK